MKRRISVTLCAVLSAVVLAACGTKGAEEPASEQEAVSEQISEESANAAEEEPTPTESIEEVDREVTPAADFSTNDISDEEQEDLEDTFTAGTSQNDAATISLGTKVSGTIESGAYAWFAFTTGDTESATYNITFVNTTVGTDDLQGYLFDEYGTQLGMGNAGSDGTPETIAADELAADTTYYVRLNPWGDETLNYTLIIQDPNKTASAESTANETSDTQNSMLDPQENLSADEIIPGSSQKDAVLIPLGTKVFGTVESDTYVWFAFATGKNAKTTYNITFVNASTETNDLQGYLFDEYGTEIGRKNAGNDGTPATISTDQLTPNTTYYVRLNPWGSETLDYSVVVKDPNAENTAYKTVGSFSEARGETVSESDGSIVAGTNQNDAVLLPMETNVSGQVKSKTSAWFGFTTGENTDITYKITFVNATEGTYDLQGYLFDEYGNELGRSNAGNDGTPATINAEELSSNTTYYIRLNPWGNEDLDYTLIIKAPVEEEEENPLVFETPFEINETQVQFVINEATFIDEGKAKEVLKPVAEAILAYPDHSILIAGTTATDGTQESCVDLSIRRAEAVKKLLVDTYGVPESQLQLVGLGYELDPFERGADRDANGKFVESEGKKNRRVVILDIDDPIAQELLKINK